MEAAPAFDSGNIIQQNPFCFKYGIACLDPEFFDAGLLKRIFDTAVIMCVSVAGAKKQS